MNVQRPKGQYDPEEAIDQTTENNAQQAGDDVEDQAVSTGQTDSNQGATDVAQATLADGGDAAGFDGAPQGITAGSGGNKINLKKSNNEEEENANEKDEKNSDEDEDEKNSEKGEGEGEESAEGDAAKSAESGAEKEGVTAAEDSGKALSTGAEDAAETGATKIGGSLLGKAAGGLGAAALAGDVVDAVARPKNQIQAGQDYAHQDYAGKVGMDEKHVDSAVDKAGDKVHNFLENVKGTTGISPDGAAEKFIGGAAKGLAKSIGHTGAMLGDYFKGQQTSSGDIQAPAGFKAKRPK